MERRLNMKPTNNSTYRIPITVEGYYDHHFKKTWKIGYKNSNELCEAVDVITKYVKDDELITKVTLSEEDNDEELVKALKLTEYPEVCVVHLPSDFKYRIYKETIVKEDVDLDEIKRIAKIKKLKERSKLCTE